MSHSYPLDTPTSQDPKPSEDSSCSPIDHSEHPDSAAFSNSLAPKNSLDITDDSSKVDPDIYAEVGQDAAITREPSLPGLCAEQTPIRPNFGGETFSYFFICKRKCWLHANHIHLQHGSEAVALGKLLHELSFVRENRKEVEVDGAKIDFLDAGAIVHEVKSSRACEEAHIFQVKFYLYLLSLRGFPQLQGRIHYPKIKKTVEVLFVPEDTAWVQQHIASIQSLLATLTPPKAPYSSLCKKCSFEEFCWG